MQADRPYAGVVCTASGLGDEVPACGPVDLTEQEYSRQMSRPDAFWHCPRCGGEAHFDDARFEALAEAREQEVPR